MLNEDYEIWFENTERINYPRGILPEKAEVVIVGGGITGVTSAYLLAKEEKRAVLLEKKKIGGGVTGCTTGFLTQLIDTDPIRLIKLFGIEKARLVLASHSKAIDDIEKVISSEKIECEFKRCVNYVYANSRGEEKKLFKMADALKALGIDVEYKKDNALKFAKFGYIKMPNQAKFHVIKYVTALAKLAKDYGAMIVEDAEALSFEDKNGFVSVKIKNAGIIQAKEVLSAAYFPFGEPPYLSHRCNLYRTYVIEYKLPEGVFAEGTYQDNLMPYHYFRIDRRDGYDRMIIGGGDHLDVLKINHEINYRLVKDYAEKLLAGYKCEEIRHWSGLILNSVDGLAYIGESKDDNIFYAFAYSGNGLTYSHITGAILLDKLMSRTNAYSKIYNTDRKISWRANIFAQ